MLLDTGLRVSEMADLRLQAGEDGASYVDVENSVLWVMGKGRRQRRVPFGGKAARALDLYLFARRRHAKAATPYLWIGERGRMGASGIYQALESRCAEADIVRLHPPQFRHTYAHLMVEANVNDADLMYLAGWRDRTMLMRYGASAAAERALAAGRRTSPAERLIG